MTIRRDGAPCAINRSTVERDERMSIVPIENIAASFLFHSCLHQYRDDPGCGTGPSGTIPA
jgi:hypothetical protein